MVGPELLFTLTSIVARHLSGSVDGVTFHPEDGVRGTARVFALGVRFRHPGLSIRLGPFLAELRAYGGLTAAVLVAHPDPRLEVTGSFKGLDDTLAVHLTPVAA